jgi:methionine synthase I (cobalamin-dependent)
MGTMLHAAYVSAGARIVQTSTSGANRLRLAGSGMENSVSEINIAGARLARIEAITRLDLGDPDDRLVTHVAVKIIELQDSVGTGSREC